MISPFWVAAAALAAGHDPCGNRPDPGAGAIPPALTEGEVVTSQQAENAATDDPMTLAQALQEIREVRMLIERRQSTLRLLAIMIVWLAVAAATIGVARFSPHSLPWTVTVLAIAAVVSSVNLGRD
jgi:hypothetical protein